MDYQKTLNLPKTDFSMRAGLAQKEPNYLAAWEEKGLYDQIRQKGAAQKDFFLHDGPPYANGNIHIGHALNKVLKDFIIKHKTMKGFNVLYVPGWDCHGLPIEHQLLTEMKKRKSDVDSVDFRKKAYDYALKYVGIQKDQFKRLGILGEWEKPYLTLNTEYEYWILKSLSTLNDKGYIYRGLKPVNWCYNCETALAEAEVAYEDHVSTSVYVKFKVTNPQAVEGLGDKDVSLLIWTTTPWTLAANVAVSVAAVFSYALVEVGDEIIIIERSLSESVLAKAGVEDFKIIKELTGEELTELVYAHPFGRSESCRVVTADYVTKEDGTGLVHTAPGHGQDDFQTGQKYGLEVVMPVNDRGVYTEEAGQFAGEHVSKVNPKIIEALTQKGTLWAADDLNHSYPHCWRCKKPIIFRATKQWFLNIDHQGLRGKLKDAVQYDIQWVPESGRERSLSMISGRPDWCLSRQRLWGVPIPAVRPKVEGGEPTLYGEVISHFADIVRQEGTNAWFEKDIKDLIPAGFICPKTGATEFEKTFDILDVWFDSGVSHQAVIKGMLGKTLPADLYLEGSDQHRGWFQSSLIPAMAIEGRPPYKEVLTHGFVVDGQGRKMSKSMGNVISPHDIIKNSGADILRLWIASSSYNEDIRVSKEILDRLIDAYRKIRNTSRYLLGNLYDFDPRQDMVDYDDLMDMDRWALHRLAGMIERVSALYDCYEFSKIYKILYAFCNEEMSNFYLDILKDRLYISATKSQKRRAAQTTLYHILNHLVRVLAPILCFTAEEMFLAMPKSAATNNIQSVHLLDWLDIPLQWNSQDIEKQFERLIDLRGHVLKALEDARREGRIGSSLEAKVVFQTASEKDYVYLKSFEHMLPETFIVSQVELNQVETVLAGLSTDFPKTDIIIKKADGQKCARSWKYSTDVGQDKDHLTLSLESARIVKEFFNG